MDRVKYTTSTMYLYKMKIIWMLMLLAKNTSGQTATLHGDSPFAVLGKPFVWTCDTADLPGGVTGTSFNLNNSKVCDVLIYRYPTSNCSKSSGTDSRITCGCRGSNISALYLSITSSFLEDTGMWSCSLDEYSQYKSSVEHHVYYGPGSSTTLNIPERFKSVKEGSYVLLECSATCLPACQYLWYKGGRLLVNTSKLQLDNLQDGDTGKYTCQSYNLVSTNTTMITILVLDEPQPPRDLKHVFSTQDTVCLVWRAGDDGGASHEFHIQFLKLNKMSTKSEAPFVLDWKDIGDVIDKPVYGGPVSACVRNLEPESTYYFRVYASNEHHTGNPSASITTSTNLKEEMTSDGLSFGSGIGVGLGLGLGFLVVGMLVGVCLVKHRRQRSRANYDNTDCTVLVN
ncbi:contactin-6 [Patella vulgata]|uniref:contactin-6 n=1 Tax=Patella vulgata TaxID=6465 RepID=UPI0024A969E4|nr:contactin-6 [Patella vulgata]